MTDKYTPDMYVVGKWSVRAPWTISSTTTYTCIAIRSFDDLYGKGEDVYNTYYVPYGCTDGVTVDGMPFKFETERLRLPNIVTLQDANGSLYYVPDTFITSYPDETEVPYSQRVISVALGPLPDTLDITNIISEISDIVKSRLGIESPVVQENVASVTSNPSYEEYLTMERVRKSAITANTSVREQLVAANTELAKLRQQIDAYEAILTENSSL